MGDSPGEMYALSVLLTLLALLAVLLRLHARRIKRVEFAWDDYLIVLALVSCLPRFHIFGLRSRLTSASGIHDCDWRLHGDR